MKKYFPFLLLMLAFQFSCQEKEWDKCIPSFDARCQDLPESGLCQAVFENWFYDSQTKTCTKISYSGCEAKGFSYQIDCEACTCFKR